MARMKNFLIGFVGQGFVGKNYADDLEERGYTVVRYALEEPYKKNKNKIRDCDIVFIAVPTPTTPKGFDHSIVQDVIGLVGAGKVAVIKSTALPGTTESIQATYPDRILLYSPEFLLERTAAQDARNPVMNIIGIAKHTPEYRTHAERVLSILPSSPHTQICSAREAEFIKYTHNSRAYAKIMMSNLFYDLAGELGCKWEEIQKAMDADPMFTNWYNQPIHQSGYAGARPGRGAGGHCFVKDFKALIDFYRQRVDDPHGVAMLEAIEQKNIHLLRASGKDIEILEEVYGKE